MKVGAIAVPEKTTGAAVIDMQMVRVGCDVLALVSIDASAF